MKIAMSVGIEETRSTVIASSSETSAQGVSFAESFDRSMADTALGASAKGIPFWPHASMRVAGDELHDGGSKSAVAEELSEASNEGKDRNAMDLLTKSAEHPLPESAAGALTNVTVHRGNGASAVDAPEDANSEDPEASFQDVGERGFPDVLTKIVAEGDNASAETQSNKPVSQKPVVPVPEDTSGESETGIVKGDEAQKIADAKMQIQAASGKNGRRETEQASGERSAQKGEAVSRGDGKAEPHKTAKKDKAASAPIATLPVEGTQAGTDAVSAPVTVPVVGTPATVAMETKADDDLTAPVAGVASRPVRGEAREAKDTKSSEASRSSKVDEAPESVVSTGSKESDTGVRRADADAGTQNIASDAPVSHPVEKGSVPVEALHGVTALAPMQSHAIPNTPVDKAQPTNSHEVQVRDNSGSTAPRLYAEDEHRTLVATPTALEVGVPGGTHGWLKVRAELTGDGGVHAWVSASSTAGAEMLRRELPTLTTYLHQEQVAVSSVVVHASSGSGSLADSSAGGSGHNREAGQGTADPQSETRREDTSAMSCAGSRLADGEEDGGREWSPSIGYAGAGGWLSVRA